MFSLILALPAYVAASFLVSALLVRVAPGLYSSGRIRRHFILFLVLPVLLLLDLVQLSGGFARQLSAIARSGFELLSGRRLMTRHHTYYGYHQRKPRSTADRKRRVSTRTMVENQAKRSSAR